MYIRTQLVRFIALLFAWSSPTESANVVFDLGGVLLQTDYRATISQLAIPSRTYIVGILAGNNPRALGKQWLNLLENVQPRTLDTITTYDGQDNRLPALMIDWMRGTQTPEQVRETVLAYIEKQSPDTLGTLQRSFFTAMTHTIFTPQRFASTQKIAPGALDFIHACKQAGHALYILSNWDGASFELLRKEPAFQGLFDLFDGWIISGQVGMIKPDPRIFEHLLATYNLAPEDTVFIDDQPLNCSAAHHAGIYPIVCSNTRALSSFWQKIPDFHAVGTELVAWYTYNATYDSEWVRASQ